MPKEHWKTEPDQKDFEGAASYLSLILPAPAVGATVAALRKNGYRVWEAASGKDALDLFQDHSVFGKPVFLNEYGVGNGQLELHYNLHSGLWASAVEPLCGASLFWWWPFVQAKNEYFQYQDVMRYHHGEDYRGRDFQLTRIALVEDLLEQALLCRQQVHLTPGLLRAHETLQVRL